MSDAEQQKPCGTFHPLPCGLDKECDVPVSYFNTELTNTKIWKDYNGDV